MMMRLAWIGVLAAWAALFLQTACGKVVRADTSHNLTCDAVAFGAAANGQRCENDEAVCYLTNAGSMSCSLKGK